MGTVYLSEDSLLGRKVALKIPRLRDADHDTVERFYREARAAAGILHRNICPVFDIGKLDGQLYITMAYIEGDPLSKYINADRPLLTGLKNLELLNLMLNPLTGTSLELLARLPRLSKLSLSATAESSVGLLQSVAALPELSHLEVGIDGQADLSPLANMHLVSLKLRGPKVENLGAILGIRLNEIELTYDAKIHENVLRSVKTLRTINGKPTGTFFSSS